MKTFFIEVRSRSGDGAAAGGNMGQDIEMAEIIQVDAEDERSAFLLARQRVETPFTFIRQMNVAATIPETAPRSLSLSRTQAESLVDLLEDCDPKKIGSWRHDIAAEIRQLFGMAARAESHVDCELPLTKLEQWRDPTIIKWMPP